jgi:B12-binding domain/radical SAM domain protein
MYDVVFLHPPSSFNKLTYPLSGVFGASLLSTDILAFEPVGMIAMLHDLSQRGYKTRIFNIGEMLLDLRYRNIDTYESIIASLQNIESHIYGIGLHWAAHAPGAIQLARMIKEFHPDSIVLMGGITATCFHKEIMQKYPFVDYVVLGEVDGLIHQIVEDLQHGRSDSFISNICYRKDGEILSTDLKSPVKQNLLYMRGSGNELIEPNKKFSKQTPEKLMKALIPLVHGCPMNCPFCGGSRHFYQKYFRRNKAEVMPVEDVLTNIMASKLEGISWFKLYGDVRFTGDNYWKELTARLKQEHLDAGFILELFSPATDEFMEAWRSVTSGKVAMTFSPESADPDVRALLGKTYTNEDIIKQVELGREMDIDVALSFMFPLPGQNFSSIVQTQDFIDNLCDRLGVLLEYMFEPFLFVDPGSPIFDDPGKYGYYLKDQTLCGLIKTLNRPHWFYSLNYSTKWLTRNQIAEAIVFVGQSRNRLEKKFLGSSSCNSFHSRLIRQQKILIRIFQNKPDLSDDEIEDIIESNLDNDLQQMNFSITNPGIDFVNLFNTK